MLLGHDLDLTAAWDASPVPVPDEQRAAMAQCRINPAGALPNGGAMWWLTNGSATLVCVVNQQRVRQGETLRLNDGDALELGLMRFVVERCEAAFAPEPIPALALAPAPAPAPDNDFELTNLMLIGSTGHPVDARDNPFSDIVDMAYRLDVADVAPDTPKAQNGTDTIAGDELLDVKGPDLMRRLHAQYLRSMRNPNEVEAVDAWSPELARAPGKNTALEDLTQRAIGFDSLYDLLGHGGTIGTVLDGLDTLTHYDLLGAEPTVNVLRLFAPADLVVQGSGLPDLTRREHHMLSADSAAQLEQVPPSPPH